MQKHSQNIFFFVDVDSYSLSLMKCQKSRFKVSGPLVYDKAFYRYTIQHVGKNSYVTLKLKRPCQKKNISLKIMIIKLK